MCLCVESSNHVSIMNRIFLNVKVPWKPRYCVWNVCAYAYYVNTHSCQFIQPLLVLPIVIWWADRSESHDMSFTIKRTNRIGRQRDRSRVLDHGLLSVVWHIALVSCKILPNFSIWVTSRLFNLQNACAYNSTSYKTRWSIVTHFAVSFSMTSKVSGYIDHSSASLCLAKSVFRFFCSFLRLFQHFSDSLMSLRVSNPRQRFWI